jgi:hypothetical protein
MIADHIVFPVESQSTYPYTLDGKHPSVGDALETFFILGGPMQPSGYGSSPPCWCCPPQSGADGEDGGLARCRIRRSDHIGGRRRMAQGGIASQDFPAGRRAVITVRATNTSS